MPTSCQLREVFALPGYLQAGGFGSDWILISLSYTCSRYVWVIFQEGFIFGCCDVSVVPLQLFFTLYASSLCAKHQVKLHSNGTVACEVLSLQRVWLANFKISKEMCSCEMCTCVRTGVDCPWNFSALLETLTVQFRSFLLSIPEQRQKSPDPIKVSCYYFDPHDLDFSRKSRALQGALGMLVHVPLPTHLCQLVELSSNRTALLNIGGQSLDWPWVAKLSETRFVLGRESSKCKPVLITPWINSCLINVCRNSFPGTTTLCSALVPAVFPQAVPLNWAKVNFFSPLKVTFFCKHLLLADLALQLWPLLSWVWYLGTKPGAGSH